MPEQLSLFDIPKETNRVTLFRRLRHPIWTENKAKLIERYLYYFVLITKHGTYIDGFAGPQEPEKPEMWAAKLVIESEPRWMRHFYLFDSDEVQTGRLKVLKDSQPDRNIQIYPGDFNKLVHDFLSGRPIKEKEACFCLLDQRTFECHWSTLDALAKYKTAGMKIELFYFLPTGWIDRAIAATKNTESLIRWWGRDDWFELRGMKPPERALLFSNRIKEEFGYGSVTPWPIFERSTGGRIMYYMIHATDHIGAPNLMYRAYHKAVGVKEPPEQFVLEFEKWRSLK
jgi:three-Cys-motif partner protein